MRRLLATLSKGCALLLVGACAIVSRPDGGPVDGVGPILDTALSSPNFQVNARPTELTLTFDEYVQLKDANREIVLTPTPEEGRPRYLQRGRDVRVEFEDVVFRDSTTYQIQFGRAVQDFNESNPAAALRYVFSTGPALDSLTLRGRLRNSLDDETVVGALVGLYRSDSDTALTQAGPDYFVRSDSSGNFAFDYLAPGTFQLAAYLDENSNFRLNQGSEAVGFLNERVVVAPGGPDTSYALTLSAELPPLIVLRGEQRYAGLLRFELNQQPTDGIEVGGLPGEVLARYVTDDTLSVAYAPALDTLREVILSRRGETDTVRLRGEAAPLPKLRAPRSGRQAEGSRTVLFTFNLPLDSVDRGRILVEGDSASYAAGAWRVDSASNRTLRWEVPSDTVSGFSVSWLPGALTTVFDSTHVDTLRSGATIEPDEGFGLLDLRFPGVDTSDERYVIELVSGSGATSRRTALGRGDTSLVLRRVPPESYRLRVIEDADGNGRYSPGDRRLGRQPERVRYFPLEQLRADWTVEARVNVLD